MSGVYKELHKKYEVYLIRNERHFKIYSFDEGAAFEPDFVLFLLCRDNNVSSIYQLFIEPKGGDRLTNEDSKIKEDFLSQIEKYHRLRTLFENRHFRLVGMPLYNEQKKAEFNKKLTEIIQ